MDALPNLEDSVGLGWVQNPLKASRHYSRGGKGFSNCMEEEEKKISSLWSEGGRVYMVERCRNGAGRFIQCSISSMEEKRFVLVFLEGRGLHGGCTILARKLHGLGVVPSFCEEWSCD